MHDPGELMHAARRALGIDELVLTVHDASFPSRADEDTGRGSPYGRGAEDLLAFADGLGFTGLQLGPQGETSRVNASPYDGTVFSRSALSISLERLAHDPEWEGLVDEATLARALRVGEGVTDRARYVAAYDFMREAMREASLAFDRRASSALRRRRAEFQASAASWLEHDAAFEAQAADRGSDDPRQWPPSFVPDAPALAVARTHAFTQFVVQAQHDAFRVRLSALGFKLWGDFQVGLSTRDVFGREALFLAGYRMGAPASRTEPMGQPWGYRVLDPGSLRAAAFFEARVRKAAGEYDGLRIDHPHGLVCPWVYRTDEADPFRAVAHGARLFESPDLADHPLLAKLAIAQPGQIDGHCPRHADGWVKELREDQVARYARSIDVVLAALAASGRGPRDLLSEVLSTCPYPLERVLQRYDLGRLRVTQKANPRDPADVYRSENARPADWIMIGNHDTPPLASVLDRWHGGEQAAAHAGYLASVLAPVDEERENLRREILGRRAAFTTAMAAQLFASPARHVNIFFPDLFGLRDRYNHPGIVDDSNWTLRVPRDFRAVHARHVAQGDAIDLRQAYALALRARPAAADREPGLVEALLQPP